MVMTDKISLLMDGELDDADAEDVLRQMKRPDAIATWVCYHVIGESLRGGCVPTAGFAARFAGRLAAEPTVIAPRASRSQPLPAVWAAAATVAAVAVVGWAAYATFETSPTAVARAHEAATIRAAQVRPPAVPADYLVAHREYSPTAPIEAIGPALRPASAWTAVPRP
jgi:sigma-E factor negative regulatory protein RseA